MMNVLPTAYNRAYLAPCLRHFAQILLRRTSDTLGTLAEMAVSQELMNQEDLRNGLNQGGGSSVN